MQRLALTIPLLTLIISDANAFLAPCRIPKAASFFDSPTTSQSLFSAGQPRRHVERRLSSLHAEVSEENVDGVDDSPVEDAHAELPSEEESDILNSPAFLRRKVDVLESDLAALEKELEEANAVYQANKEEWGPKFDDLNKESQLIQERMSRQGELGKEEATMDVARKMLDVIDNYDRAFNAMDPTTNEEVGITDAYKNTYDMILTAFAELNITKVETIGTEFNYELHQAVMQMPSDEYEEGIVCSELQAGWICGDKLLRPAMVCVAV